MTQGTRPDIAFAVNQASRFNLKHSEIHWQAVKRIFRYLKGTIDHKLTYQREEQPKLHAFCDSDWASDVDSRRSCTGYVVRLGDTAIAWNSKKQSIVALSSTEAEYIALATALQEIIWLKNLFDELTFVHGEPVKVYVDNQSAIQLANTPGYRQRTKHIDIRYHRIREEINAGVIELAHVSTNVMVADALTKSVSAEKTKFCAAKVGLRP